jgi:hypothetical protein
LTGDGRPEAVLELNCVIGPEEDHPHTAFLVVSLDGSGELRTVGGWVGLIPPDWPVVVSIRTFQSFWVQDGRLLVEHEWSLPDFEYVPGAAAAYEWDGEAFRIVPSGLFGVFGTSDDPQGPPIDLGPDDGYVARSLGCPGGEIAAGPLDVVEGNQVFRGAFVYDLMQRPYVPHLVDLAGDGRRHVLVHILCREAGADRYQAQSEGVGVRGQGILVLDRTSDGFTAVDIISEPGKFIGDWYVPAPGMLSTSAHVPGQNGAMEDLILTWNGQYFQR